MKNTRSTNLRRAWPSSDLSERLPERTRSRSEKDFRLQQKHHHTPPPPPHISPGPPQGYQMPGESDNNHHHNHYHP